MSQDLSFIKQELTNCEEFTSPFDIDINSHVKYITLKDKQEYFYTGGTYVGMNDNKIILKTEKTKLYIPLTIKHPDGTILYKTRLFVVNEEDTKLPDKKKQHYESIIQSQQSIIDKMSQKIHQLTKLNETQNVKLSKYDVLVKKLIQERKR